MEKWKEIQGYDHLYQISDMGRVRNKRGKIIGHIGHDGYSHVMLRKGGKYKNIRTHRLVWEYFGGGMPYGDLVIDHINNNKSDNRLINLQVIPFRKNVHKGTVSPNSGIIGVQWASNKKRWAAQISINNKRIRLGYRKTKKEAQQLYEQALMQTKKQNNDQTGKQTARRRHA